MEESLNIHFIDTVDSTNSEISRLVSEEKLVLENYTTLIAKNQLAGRGRGNHAWFSKPSKSLLMSTYMQVPDTNFWRSNIGELMLVSATAAVSALRQLISPKQFENLGVRIKKPNDIYARDKKLAGILGELITCDSPLPGVLECVVGIGLNVSLTADELPFENATSLLIEGVDTEDFLQKFPPRYLHELKKYTP
jgi:BirA family biotin operon repressor/biotin-[acetyl-CoA-carboxylase] ligase